MLDRRTFLKSVGLSTMIATLPGCNKILFSDGEYDYNDNLIERLNLNSTVQITNDISAKFGEYEGKRFQVGSAIIYDDDYMVTADHVITYIGDVKHMFGSTITIVPESYTSEITTNDLEVKVIKQWPEYDLSLLSNPYSSVEDTIYHPAKRGNSDELKKGQVIVSQGNARGMYPVYNLSHVARTELPLTKGKPPTIFIKDEELFVSTFSGIPGDSGGGAYAIRDGKPELVGIYKMSVNDISLTFIHKINSINKIIKEYIAAGG